MSEFDERMEHAHEAWKRRWAKERPQKTPQKNRYAVVFECDEETLQAVLLSMKGFPTANRTCRRVPFGWRPGDVL